MKYKALPQNGELYYGQPTFLVQLTKEEIKRVDMTGKLIIKTTTYRHTDTNLDTEEVKEWTTTENRRVYTFIGQEVDKKYYRKLKEAQIQMMARGGMLLVRTFLTHAQMLPTYRLKPIPLGDTTYYAEIWCSSYSEATDVANYFDERLPQKFFDTYLGVAFDVTSNEN